MSDVESRILPNDLNAEQAILASMLMSPDASEIGLALLQPDDFYRTGHRAIFLCMQVVHESGAPIDLITVNAELRARELLEEAGGPEYLVAIMQQVPTIDHVERYARIVKEQTRRREFINFGREIERYAFENPNYDEVRAWALEHMLRLEDEAESSSTLRIGDWKKISDQYGDIEWVWENWLPRGMVSILAAETGIGKTACAMGLSGVLTMPHRDWPDGTPGPDRCEQVVFIETESRTHLLIQRMRNWKLDGFEVIQQTPGPDRMVIDIASRVQQRTLAEAVKRSGARLLVIDSLSAGHALDENSDDMKHLLLDLCRLAHEANVALLAIHHLRKRRNNETTATTLDRLRGSSTIAQLAVVTLTLERPDPNSRTLALRQIKNNIAPEQPAVGMEITEDGIVWTDAPGGDEEEQMTTLDRAQEFVMATLQEGPIESTALYERGANHGLSRSTLYRAVKSLDVDRSRHGWVALPEDVMQFDFETVK
jgi:replicative DNA helicase